MNTKSCKARTLIATILSVCAAAVLLLVGVSCFLLVVANNFSYAIYDLVYGYGLRDAILDLIIQFIETVPDLAFIIASFLAAALILLKKPRWLLVPFSLMTFCVLYWASTQFSYMLQLIYWKEFYANALFFSFIPGFFQGTHNVCFAVVCGLLIAFLILKKYLQNKVVKIVKIVLDVVFVVALVALIGISVVCFGTDFVSFMRYSAHFYDFGDVITFLIDLGLGFANAILVCIFPVAFLATKLAIDFIPAKCCKKVECSAEPVVE